MNELAWLVGHRFQLLTRREYDWVVTFDNDASIVVACLWRLVQIGAEIICCIFAISVLRFQQLTVAEYVPTDNQEVPHGERQAQLTSVLCSSDN